MYPDLSENIANIFSCYPVQFGTYSDGYTGSVGGCAQFVLRDRSNSATPRNFCFYACLLDQGFLALVASFVWCLQLPNNFKTSRD